MEKVEEQKLYITVRFYSNKYGSGVVYEVNKEPNEERIGKPYLSAVEPEQLVLEHEITLPEFSYDPVDFELDDLGRRRKVVMAEYTKAIAEIDDRVMQLTAIEAPVGEE